MIVGNASLQAFAALTQLTLLDLTSAQVSLPCRAADMATLSCCSGRRCQKELQSCLVRPPRQSFGFSS